MHRDVRRHRFVVLVGSTAAAITVMLGFAGTPRGSAQSQAGAPLSQAEAPAPQSFEVASIKPSAEDGRRVTVGISPGGRYTATGVTLKFLIMQAYDIRDFQISGGPGWLGSERYDIVAKADTPSLNREKVKVLLKSLLAERFNLKVHRETRELPVYALVVGKNGPKLQKSETQSDAADIGAPPRQPQPGAPGTEDREVRGGEGRPGAKGAMIRMGRGQVNAQMATLQDLATLLAQQVGRPVTDKTGLAGKYDFSLEWTPDESLRGTGLFGESPGPEPAPATDSSGPSIFTALQEQLGLKLESEKGPVEILVIDHVDKASAN